MIFGRFLFGTGGEVLTTIIFTWVAQRFEGKSQILPNFIVIVSFRFGLLGNAFLNPWLASTYEIEYTMYFGSTITIFGCLSLTVAFMLDEFQKR